MSTTPDVLQDVSDPLAAVKITEYRYLLIGRFFFIMALRMLATIAGWWIYKLTKDPFAIGLIGLAEVIPALSLALYSGYRVDMSEKRRLLLNCILAYLGISVAMVICAFGFSWQWLSSKMLVSCIYFFIFLTGIFRSFVGPTFSALIATIVPRNFLQNATTWSQGSWLMASVSGHAAGGFLIWGFGVNGTLIIVACLIFTAFLFLYRLKPKPILNSKKDKPTLESVKEGLRFVFKTKELLGAMALDMFAVLFGGVVAMVPVFAQDILKVGAIGFGWLNAAMDIGAILIVILLTLFPLKGGQGRKLMFAVGGFGLCILIFALSKWFLVSFLMLVIAGMLDGVSIVIRGTVMQLKTPDNMRGRVSSVSSMFVNSSNELGQFESGTAARFMGVIPSVIFGGCMTMLVAFTTWFKAPKLRRFEY